MRPKYAWLGIVSALLSLLLSGMAEFGYCDRLLPISTYLQIVGVAILPISASYLFPIPKKMATAKVMEILLVADAIAASFGALLLFRCSASWSAPARWVLETAFSLTVSALFLAAEKIDKEKDTKAPDSTNEKEKGKKLQ